MNRIDYLDLSLPLNRSNISHKCYFGNTYQHDFHSNESHLNAIIDLIISLGRNLKENDRSDTRIFDNISNSLQNKNKLLKDLSENMDFQKSQVNDLLKSLNKTSKCQALNLKERLEFIDNNMTYKFNEINIKLEKIENMIANLEKLVLS